jgi:hypothetical protein
MPQITISAYVPAEPSAVFTHVTTFPTHGEPDARLLENKYGRIEKRDGLAFTFIDNSRPDTDTRLLYTFEPPQRRCMQHLDSDWADRTDTFLPSGNGTEWTILWEPKSKGAPFLIRWLFFRWKDRQRLYNQIMQPVVDHFGKQDFY